VALRTLPVLLVILCEIEGTALLNVEVPTDGTVGINCLDWVSSDLLNLQEFNVKDEHTLRLVLAPVCG
jgi:hypothetical protein